MSQPKVKTPYDDFKDLFYKWVRIYDCVIAQNVFDSHFEITLKTIAYITVITLIFSLFLYTIAFDSAVGVMECICLMPASAQVSKLSFSFFKYRIKW